MQSYGPSTGSIILILAVRNRNKTNQSQQGKKGNSNMLWLWHILLPSSFLCGKIFPAHPWLSLSGRWCYRISFNCSLHITTLLGLYSPVIHLSCHKHTHIWFSLFTVCCYWPTSQVPPSHRNTHKPQNHNHLSYPVRSEEEEQNIHTEGWHVFLPVEWNIKMSRIRVLPPPAFVVRNTVLSNRAVV